MALKTPIVTLFTLFPLVFCSAAWAGPETSPGPEDEVEAALTEEPSGVPETPEADVTASVEFVLPAAPPPSLQTLVDERRDALRKRRKAQFDLYSGRRFYLPPGLLAHTEAMDRYRDAVRELYRQQRDYNKMYRDARMSYMNPWSKPFHDLAEERHYAMQMDQLDWQELRDELTLGPPFAYAGPLGFPW